MTTALLYARTSHRRAVDDRRLQDRPVDLRISGPTGGREVTRNGGPSRSPAILAKPETTSSSPFRTSFGCSWWSGQSTASTNPLRVVQEEPDTN